MIVQKGRYFQMWKTITAPSAVSCWASHGTEANPNLPRRWLKMPHCELSIQRNERMPGSAGTAQGIRKRSEEHTSELQSLAYLVCRLLLEKKKQTRTQTATQQQSS